MPVLFSNLSKATKKFASSAPLHKLKTVSVRAGSSVSSTAATRSAISVKFPVIVVKSPVISDKSPVISAKSAAVAVVRLATLVATSPTLVATSATLVVRSDTLPARSATLPVSVLTSPATVRPYHKLPAEVMIAMSTRTVITFSIFVAIFHSRSYSIAT